MLKSGKGKIYTAVIREMIPRQNRCSRKVPENEKQALSFPAGLPLPIIVNRTSNHPQKVGAPVSAFLRRFVASSTDWVVSVHLRGLKRGVGAFVRDCGRERFAPPKLKCQGR